MRTLTVIAASIALLFGAAAAQAATDREGRILLTQDQLNGNLPEGILNEIPSDYYWNGKKFIFAARPSEKKALPDVGEGAQNVTYSPDSSMVAYTMDGDLYVTELATMERKRVTLDGSDVISNGYASWVYYEEIFGRPSNYKAFWWSPDSRKLGFYRFDNSLVPVFPIYHSDGKHGFLNNTRYPKAGDPNPGVRIGMADVTADNPSESIVWAGFDESEDQYFGIPFWGADSREFYIARMPRVQNTLELFAVSAADGSMRSVYREEYPTWIDWMEEIVFSRDGLYMVRDIDGWQQIYFLPYDGSGARKLTSGENWSISLVGVDENGDCRQKGDVYFLAKRASTLRRALYRVDTMGNIEPLTDEDYDVTKLEMSDDYRQFAATYSNGRTPSKVSIFKTGKRSRNGSLRETVIADMKGPEFDKYAVALPEIIYIETEDGFRLPAQIIYPLDFDPSVKYPVHIDIYGGPDTPLVRDRWRGINDATQWWANNGIIQITIDNRAGGHCGRKGLDMIYRHLMKYELQDYVAWAKYLRSLPYVDGDKLGVEGFSFGGCMTVVCLTRGAEYFSYGIAGGGVYDWTLYDSHYTERYMDTPERNPEGYADTVLGMVDLYPTEYDGSLEKPSHMLKITHGTGDDNVHFQQTLQLVDELQKHNKRFELMVYPEGMHGYKGYQGTHFNNANKLFWLTWLKD